MTIYQLPDPKNFEHQLQGKNVHLFTLQNRAGMQVALTDYGARLVSALVPDKHGNLIDVVLGFDHIQGYLQAKEKYHGATIGRVANRIGNGKFQIDDQEFTLAQNNGTNCLHGGEEGFHTKVWDRQVNMKKQVTFYYVSPDGEEGFPGEVKVSVSYELTEKNEIVMHFRASADRKTVVNLTNHAYFNLNGEGNGDILNHQVSIDAEQFLPIKDNQTPIGNIIPVEGSAFDFRTSKKIVDDINSHEEQITLAKGYDHTYVNTHPISSPIAQAYAEESGIVLDVFSDNPGLHLYTGNFLADDLGKSGHRYLTNGGLCFEAQYFPDSPNRDTFPSVIIEPGKDYEQTIIYKFGIRK